jgi:hypothetical protein
MKKVYNGEFTKVLISRGFGAGWSTWNYDWPEMAFDPEIIELVEKEASIDVIDKLASIKYPNAYLGAIVALEVVLVKTGTEFIIHEYDGSESIQTKDDFTWLQA